MSTYYPNIKEALLPQLNNVRTAVCKRTITCIAYMTITCNDQLYSEMMNNLLGELCNSNNNTAKIYINCITAVCKHSGSRMDPYLHKIIEQIIRFIEVSDDDLKEACFQILEIFVRRCPKEVSGYIENVGFQAFNIWKNFNPISSFVLDCSIELEVYFLRSKLQL